ncbi:MAG: hypothetical protein ABIP56_03965 [Dokdonella sp.]
MSETPDPEPSDQLPPEPLAPFDAPTAVPPERGNQNERKRFALIAMVGVAFVLGVVDTWLFGPPGPLQGGRLLAALVGNAALLLIGFHWLHLDAEQLVIRRPAWLNIGIILVAVAFVPYYLFKTRPEGKRGIAIAGFFGVVVAVSLAMSFGSALVSIVSGDPASSTTTPI